MIRGYLLLAVLGIFLGAMVFAVKHAHGAESPGGIWPPDDMPRAQIEAALEIMAIFRSCRTVASEYDRAGKMRGFRVLCDF